MTSPAPQSPVVVPSRDDTVAEHSLGWMGGPLGMLARVGSSWWNPLRVLIVIGTLAYILGFILDMSCRTDGWQSPGNYEHLCYTDIAPLYGMRGFADGIIPYIEPTAAGDYLEYPVLTGGFMQVAALVTSMVASAYPDGRTSLVFFDVNVVLLFVAYLTTVVTTALLVRRRPWDALMVAVAPTMILAATINWDLLPLAFTGLALLAWSRRHPTWAGVFLGLAAAAKFYPLLLVGGFLVLSLRSGRWREFGLLVAGTVGSWLAVNVPVAMANAEGWSYFYRFSQERGEDFGSIWFMLSQWGLVQIPAERLNTLASGLFLLFCAGIAWIVLTAPRRPRLVSVLFLIVVAFTLTNKVYSPQYSLWLLPLAVLARPRWRDFLIWQLGEVIYFVGIWWFLVEYGRDDTTGLTGPEYGFAVLARVITTVYLATLVVRDMYDVDADPVRSDGISQDADDPAGGVYDAAPDRFTLGPARHRTARS